MRCDKTIRSGACWAGIAAVLLFNAGCASTLPDREQRMTRGYLYYCDGAGGGGPVKNYAAGVKKGMLDAGYDGAGEMFVWETGLGLVADQEASNEYKRGKAKSLAERIKSYQESYPGRPVTLIGLSAGTAIAVFALEELPAGVMVSNVVLLSGSLSSTHDLTAALRHVSGKIYIFTSEQDAVLKALLPLGGTADRDSGTTDTIGVHGARMPLAAGADTRRAYAQQVVQIPWTEQFARYGNMGGHTDSVNAGFIQHCVAPLATTLKAMPAAGLKPGEVENPDFRRWAGFAPGSWVEFDGEQVVAGQRTPLRVRVKLVARHHDSLRVAREYLGSTGADLVGHELFVSAGIQPSEHPLTYPTAKVEERPPVNVSVNGRAYECRTKALVADGDFPAWGSRVNAVVSSNPEIPSGIGRIEVSTRLQGKDVRFSLTAVRFEAIPFKQE